MISKKWVRSFDRTERVEALIARPDRYTHLFQTVAQAGAVIARGRGLSYCLASVGAQSLALDLRYFNRFLAFDSSRGLLHVECGASVGDVLNFSLPRGWILPVMPGLPQITLGGALAANVHGKNHYRRGTLKDCVEKIYLYHPQHGECVCSSTENAELFHLTLGGMGLTGIIFSVVLRLERQAANASHLERIPVASLREAAALFTERASHFDSLYSWHRLASGEAAGFVYAERAVEVANIDNEITQAESMRYAGDAVRVSAWPILNHWPSLFAWVNEQKEKWAPLSETLSLKASLFPALNHESYFALFGTRGFHEYQCLIPLDTWVDFAPEFLRLARQHGVQLPILSLKLFRGEARYLNYSGDGISLGLNLTRHAANENTKFLASLDELIIQNGGRVNIYKDSRMSARTAERMFPEYGAFCSALVRHDPDKLFQSQLRERLGV